MNKSAYYTTTIFFALALSACSSSERNAREKTFETMLQHAKDTGMCPANVDPKVTYLNIGAEINPKALPENGVRPSFILMTDFGDDELGTQLASLHEAYHHCSLMHSKVYSELNIMTTYGKLIKTQGKTFTFSNEYGLETTISSMEEAFAYYHSAQDFPDRMIGWQTLKERRPESYELAKFAQLITQIYEVNDISTEGGYIIEKITRRSLNPEDIEIILAIFASVENQQNTADQAMALIITYFP